MDHGSWTTAKEHTKECAGKTAFMQTAWLSKAVVFEDLDY